MIPVREVSKKWFKSASFRKAYDALDDQFALANAFIAARTTAKLRQEQVAERMNTTPAFIVRLEGGKQSPSYATLLKFAKATGTKLRITFEEG